MKVSIIFRVTVFLVLTGLVSCVSLKEVSAGTEIPFTLEHGNIILEVSVNGETGKYSWNMLSNTSISVNVDPAWPQLTYCVPQKENRIYLPEELVIGGVPLKIYSKIWYEERGNDYLASYGLAGVLGGNIFAGYWCEVSFSTQKIILHRVKPAGYTQSVKGYLLAKSFLMIPGTIDGTDYGFVITGSDTWASSPIIYPPDAVTDKLRNEYIQFDAKNGIHYWTRSGNIQVLGDTFTGIISGTSPGLTGLFENADFKLLGQPVSGMHMGGLSWIFLRNYDLLFDFTNQSAETTDIDWDKSPVTTVWYVTRNNIKDPRAVFPREYPGGELGAFVYCTPMGAELFLATDSPVRSIGITEDIVITQINGVPAERLTAESGGNITLNLDYQTELTVIGTDGQEQVIALSRIFGE